MNGIQGLNHTSFGGGKANAVNKAIKSAADDVIKNVSKIIAEDAANEVNNELPKGLKKINKFLSDHDGEVQNQVINAIFTTTLAPLMIWKNPFSKKSEKDKAYSALRQPISAGIAVSGGLAATLGINKALDVLANEGYIKSLDLRMNPNESYLKSQFKAEMKKAVKEGKTADFLKQYGETGNSKEAVKNALAKYTETVKASRQQLFETLMTEAPENIKAEAGKIFVNGKQVADNIPNLGNEKQLKTFLDKFNVKNVKEMAGKSQDELRAVAKKVIKEIGTDFGTLKKYALPFINIPVTVLTCTALNWVYPRFVETFFPGLLKSDKAPEQQGGNK
ncbi:hypothetical protein IJ732_00870 [bacterium]|nr:hypothetical protein [bacterium]